MDEYATNDLYALPALGAHLRLTRGTLYGNILLPNRYALHFHEERAQSSPENSLFNVKTLIPIYYRAHDQWSLGPEKILSKDEYEFEHQTIENLLAALNKLAALETPDTFPEIGQIRKSHTLIKQENGDLNVQYVITQLGKSPVDIVTGFTFNPANNRFNDPLAESFTDAATGRLTDPYGKLLSISEEHPERLIMG